MAHELLVSWIADGLGNTWKDAWMANDLPAIPRQLLSEAFDDFHGVMRRLQDMQQRESSTVTVIYLCLAGDTPRASQPVHHLSDIPHRVRLYERVLALLTHASNPTLWAASQVNFGNELFQNPQGNRAANMERAIAAYQAALIVYTHDKLPNQWAMTQNNLGEMYRKSLFYG